MSLLSFVFNTTKRQPLQGGFGLVELLVSVSIVVLVAGIVLARQEAFNGAVLLRNEAYDIAFALREVQLSAVSAQGREGEFRDTIGVHFTASAIDDANTQFLVFRDGAADPAAGPNGVYNADDDMLVGVPRQIDERFEIHEIRADGVPLSGNEVYIIYVRPNFDARFFVGPGTANELSENVIEIDLKRVGVDVDPADPGTVRTIEVTATGQIAVQ